MTHDTPPENAPPSLMERWDDEKQIKYLRAGVMQMETALLASEHLQQHAEAEVARLTAERDAAEERARRYRDALEEALYRLGRSRVWGGTDWTYHALSPAQYRPVLESIDRALTEGGADAD